MLSQAFMCFSDWFCLGGVMGTIKGSNLDRSLDAIRPWTSTLNKCLKFIFSSSNQCRLSRVLTMMIRMLIITMVLFNRTLYICLSLNRFKLLLNGPLKILNTLSHILELTNLFTWIFAYKGRKYICFLSSFVSFPIWITILIKDSVNSLFLFFSLTNLMM